MFAGKDLEPGTVQKRDGQIRIAARDAMSSVGFDVVREAAVSAFLGETDRVLPDELARGAWERIIAARDKELAPHLFSQGLFQDELRENRMK